MSGKAKKSPLSWCAGDVGGQGCGNREAESCTCPSPLLVECIRGFRHFVDGWFPGSGASRVSHSGDRYRERNGYPGSEGARGEFIRAVVICGGWVPQVGAL